jgi:hypothetical protein
LSFPMGVRTPERMTPVCNDFSPSFDPAPIQCPANERPGRYRTLAVS